MARTREDQPLLPSVLDRLIDQDPGNQREAARPRSQVVRELRQSVRRDLQNLLNTRYRSGPLPEDLEELDLSLVAYGIPDFTGVAMSGPSDRQELCKVIERTIRKFETRFKSVKVTLVENKEDFDRTLRFRIDAMMYAEPAPEAVVFDSQLEPTLAEFHIESQ